MSKAKRPSKKSRLKSAESRVRVLVSDAPLRGRFGTVDATVLQREAVRVTGSAAVAKAWMQRANPLLGNITPLEAVERNKGRDALSILLNVAGV